MAKSRTNVTCYWTSNCFSKSPFCLSQIPNQYIIHADLARNKPEALVNILIVYSNKIHSCQTATAPRTAEKAIGLISKKKKKEIPLPEQHTFLYTSFLCRCFARLCSYLHVLFVLWRKFSMCWPVLDLFAAVFVVAAVFFFFFFLLPLIITLVAAYFLTAPRENCHVLLPTKYMIPLRFLSLALALSSVINVNVDIKTYLVEGKTRICCCCFFPLKVRWPCDLPLKREGAWSAKIHPSLHEGVDGRTAYGRFF